MLTFLIFVGLFAHIIMAIGAHTLLEDFNTRWYKPKYKKYLLIPVVAELALGLAILAGLYTIMYTFISEFLKD
jgi:hypothetical protein